MASSFEENSMRRAYTWPILIVIDTSKSIGRASIQKVNSDLSMLPRLIEEDPLMRKAARVALISFNSQAHLLLPFTDEVPTYLPTLEVYGSSNYRDAFRLASSSLTDEIKAMREQGREVGQPLIIFASRGYPDDNDWRTALADLKGPTSKKPPFRERCVLLAVALGKANVPILQEVSSVYIARDSSIILALRELSLIANSGSWAGAYGFAWAQEIW